MADATDLLVIKFKADKVKNEAASKQAGRPMYDDIELCEIRAAGDRNTVKVFPAHSFHRWINNDDDGSQEKQTYAQRWSAQYRRFKENRDQVQDGTPLSELPFLTEAKRAELKALSIYTAETLAALDGQNLKTLGTGGRELKNQAQAYIDNASGSANVTRMAAEIESLKTQIMDLGANPKLPPPVEAPEPEAVDEFEAWADDDLKAWIAQQTGSRPKGNPSHDTLVRMAREASAEAA